MYVKSAELAKIHGVDHLLACIRIDTQAIYDGIWCTLQGLHYEINDKMKQLKSKQTSMLSFLYQLTKHIKKILSYQLSHKDTKAQRRNMKFRPFRLLSGGQVYKELNLLLTKL